MPILCWHFAHYASHFAHYASHFAHYASIMPNAFGCLLCFKLCRHNRPVPTFELVHGLELSGKLQPAMHVLAQYRLVCHSVTEI